MDIRKGLAISVASLAAFAGGNAESAETLAYVFEEVANNADVLVTVPVNNAVEKELTTVSRSGSTLTVPAASMSAGAYNAGSFVKYYVRFIDGPAAGLWASITSNTATAITLDNPAVAALASAGGGNTIRIYKHHTLASVFPDALLNTAVVDGSQVLFFDSSATQNKPAGSGGVASYTTFFNLGWGTNAERPLLPETAFVIRNTTGTALQYIATGTAPDHAVAYLLTSGANKDTALGTGYPVPVTVEDTGLGAQNRQMLLQPSNVLNPAPGSAAIYTHTDFFNLGWGANAGVSLAANSAFILRQVATDTDSGKSTVVKPY